MFCTNREYGKYSSKLSVVAVTLTLLLPACGIFRKKKSHDNAPTISDPNVPGVDLTAEVKQLWLQRANQTLRLGQPLREVKDAEKLTELPFRDASLELMKDKAFYDMIADFSAYWLGIKPANWRSEIVDPFGRPTVTTEGEPVSGIDMNLLLTTPVMNSAMQLAKGQDYFAALFNEQGPVPLVTLGSPYFFFLKDDGSYEISELSPTNTRLEVLRRLRAEAQKLKEFTGTFDRDAYSKEFSKALASFSFGSIIGEFSPTPSVDDFSGQSLLNEIFGWLYSQGEPTPAEGAKVFESVISKLETLAMYHDQLESRFPFGQPAALEHVVDFQMADLTDFGAGPITRQHWDGQIFNKLQNSSTNRNRKRAAWVLKRFFCDDLTPLNVEAPVEHHNDQHGSDPACYSCHFKLDPLAGYFRELGAGGKSYKDSPIIRFDDDVVQDRGEYEKLWRSTAPGREWNIGFIRSTVDEKVNTYGTNFSDLLSLLQTAPEVKECFVRRVFEYSVGENQSYDRAWGREVLARMEETAKSDRLAAIKGVFADIATSKAFIAPERNNNVCYDLPQGTQTGNRAPCRIASILERNCTSCHSTNGARGGLDLSTWKVQSDGKAGFTHVKNGKQLASNESLAAILDRLNTADPKLSMPLMKTMPASERQELFLWLQGKANQ